MIPVTFAHHWVASVLDVTGEFETHFDAWRLQREIYEATDAYEATATVDLTNVTFLPSLALAVLIAARAENHTRGARLHLKAPPGSLAARILAVVGVPLCDGLTART